MLGLVLRSRRQSWQLCGAPKFIEAAKLIDHQYTAHATTEWIALAGVASCTMAAFLTDEKERESHGLRQR